MALGAITQLTDDTKGLNLPVVPGAMKQTFTTIVGDSSYPTGGTAVTAANLGLGTLVFAFAFISATTASNNTIIGAAFNNATGKLQTFQSSSTSPVALIEAASTTNCSGVTITVVAYGY
jgi:hypothetical protein